MGFDTVDDRGFTHAFRANVMPPHIQFEAPGMPGCNYAIPKMAADCTSEICVVIQPNIFKIPEGCHLKNTGKENLIIRVIICECNCISDNRKINLAPYTIVVQFHCDIMLS